MRQSPIQALVGSQGTVFLTGGATLDHLKDGEEVRMCEVGIPVDHEVSVAVSELQAQHLALYRLAYHHGAEWQCEEPCDHGKCLSCDLRTLEDRWIAERATLRREESVSA